MSNLTTIDEMALSQFTKSLETFRDEIKRHCNKMKNEIGSAACVMKDQDSRIALAKAMQVCDDILDQLNPAQMVLEKTLKMGNMMKNKPKI